MGVHVHCLAIGRDDGGHSDTLSLPPYLLCMGFPTDPVPVACITGLHEEYACNAIWF